MEPKKCPECQKPFTPTDRRQKYCSVTCRTRFLNARHRNATGPIKRRGPRKKYEKESACLQCKASLLHTGRRRFCSEECAERYWNESRNKGVQAGYHFLTQINEEALTATCSVCGPTEIRHAGTKRLKNGQLPYVCIYKRQQSYGLAARRESDWRKRGINFTVEEFEAMLEEQGGVCAICGRDGERTLHVDHDHKTGKVRGLLCDNCNHGLGKLGDDPDQLEAGAHYLRSRS